MIQFVNVLFEEVKIVKVEVDLLWAWTVNT